MVVAPAESAPGWASTVLSLVSCPAASCKAPLTWRVNQIVCSGQETHQFSQPRRGCRILELHTSHLDTPVWDSYQSDELVNEYAGIWAFGHLGLLDQDFSQRGYRVGTGASEGFYRTIHSLIRQHMKEPARLAVDIGAGVGRTAHDIAADYPAATVIGIDQSLAMLQLASEITVSNRNLELDLQHRGFGLVVVPGSRLAVTPNLIYLHANAEEIDVPEATPTGELADLVVLSNVLDRTASPSQLLRVAMTLVRPGGALLLSVSGSWLLREHWEEIPNALAYCLDTLSHAGFEIQEAIQNLVLREVVNARGAVEEWPVSVVVARRSNVAPVESTVASAVSQDTQL